MKKTSFIIFFVLLFCIELSVFALESDHPKAVFLGLDDGQVVGIDLESWDVLYYDTYLSGPWMTYDIEYFEDINKLVFAAGETHYWIGIIDLNNGEVMYPKPDIEGLGSRMIKYNFRISEPNKILVQFADRAWPLVLEHEVEEFKSTIQLVEYDVKKDEWTIKDINGWENIIRYIFNNMSDSSKDHIYDKSLLLNELVQKRILNNGAKKGDIFLKDIIGDVQIHTDYFLCHRDNTLIIVQVDDDSFKVVKEFPEEIFLNDEKLLKPNSVCFVFEPIELKVPDNEEQ